jgi:hypothetical protein
VELNALRALERTVPRVWGINSTRLTCRNEAYSYNLCLDSAFVSDDVHVGATFINKRCSRCVDVRRAAWIVSFIVRHRPCRDKDQRMPRMRVPACASARLPNIAHDRPI